MRTSAWTRRSFLASSLATAAALLARGAPAQAVPPDQAPGRLSLYITHTREHATIIYRDEAGRYDPAALRRLDHLLRCHATGEVAGIDVRTIEFLRAVDQVLGGDRAIHVISAFRSAAYNDWLIRHGSRVAARSLHLDGRAIDVRFPGLPLGDVHRMALALSAGGVGFYPGSQFVHLDSGGARSW